MKNIFVHSKSQDQNLDELHTDHDSVLKRAMSEILLKADAMAIILIMLGGIVAVGKETRAFGIMLACAGFTMLLLRIGDHLADSDGQ